ncbi:RES family NAD+ phosphorylase [Paraburkholderia bryophila]|uniref:RES family NAD+ phosphorylase n=1 Tax=Paraburkholderia bryophila TaxID=420952 RepID=UPI00234A3BDC|nr:RES family NAD+ phosphorylase [Paraburkholderia bryophila]WCM23667.1 RES family NAD+ phosphorylase [Paraburkholderia bryophila]
MFYGATEKGIAIAEVRPPVGSHVVVADFEVVRELRLLDLQRLGSVGIRPGSSRFDPTTLDHASRCGFLASLVQQLNMPVMPEAQDYGYFPTQVIADFLATHPKLELDGIIFTSTQIPTESGRNVILFPKASAVENAAESSSFEATVHLWESDEDGMRFEPTICTPARAPEGSSKAQLLRETTPALRLNRDTIEIHRVDAVLYTTRSFSVAHEVDTGPRGVKKY